jgi:hypothetical protein
MTTLAEYKYLGNDAEVRKGVGLTMVKESPWLKELPFVELESNNVSRYKMELTDGGATAHEVGDAWTTVNPTWEYRDASLAILGDNVDDDNFGQLSAGPEDTMAMKIELKSKGVSQMFDKLSVYGQTTSTGVLSSTKNFKGLLRLIAEAEGSTVTDLDGWVYTGDGSAAHNTQVLLAASGASAALALAMIDALVDAVKPKATHIIMSRLNRRKLNGLAQAAGNNLEHDKDQLGYPVTRYGEQIVLIDDQIIDNMNDSSTLVTAIASYDYTQAATTAKDTSPIFAVRMAEDGLCGINGLGMIQVVDLGELESKDAKGKRVKFYCGMRLTNKKAAAVLMNANYAG